MSILSCQKDILKHDLTVNFAKSITIEPNSDFTINETIPLDIQIIKKGGIPKMIGTDITSTSLTVDGEEKIFYQYKEQHINDKSNEGVVTSRFFCPWVSEYLWDGNDCFVYCYIQGILII